MSVTRWLVEIAPGGDGEARVVIRSPEDEAPIGPPRTMPLAGGGVAFDENVAAALARVRAREPQEGDTVALGTELFDRLIGAETWEEIVAGSESAIELGLAIDDELGELQEMPWELMHTGDHFLAASQDPYVATLRIVPDTAGEIEPVAGLPRVLFVIGTKLHDPVIRPGAEVVGILRKTQAGNSIVASVLQRAKPSEIQERIRKFRPDVVHFVAHGTPGEIQLVDDATGRAAPFGAEPIWQMINADGHRPAVVILSACSSGAAVVGDHRVPTGRPEVASPMAADLVRHGVPIAVAMGGNVSDMACRLFTRAFADAMLRGLPMSVAMARGRTGAILADAASASARIDWAFPLVFISQQVPAGFRPIDSASVELVQNATRDLLVNLDPPVFVGRLDIFEALDEMIEEPGSVNLLAVQSGWAADGRLEEYRDGLGETRLLDELTSRVLRRNQIPIRLVNLDDDVPRSRHELAAMIVREIRFMRDSLDLPPLERSAVLDTLVPLLKETTQELIQGMDPRSKLPYILAPESWPEDAAGPPRGAMVEPLVRDLDDLRTDAAARHPDFFGPSPGIVLFLGQIHEWDAAADAVFEWAKDKLDGPSAAGEPVRATSIVATFSHKEAVRERVAGWVQQLTPAGRMRYRCLTQLEAEEEILAYQWLLLNPRRAAVHDEDKLAYVPRDPQATLWRSSLRYALEGLPGKLDHAVYRLIYEQSTAFAPDGLFLHGDDGAVLEEQLGGLPP